MVQTSSRMSSFAKLDASFVGSLSCQNLVEISGNAAEILFLVEDFQVPNGGFGSFAGLIVRYTYCDCSKRKEIWHSCSAYVPNVTFNF